MNYDDACVKMNIQSAPCCASCSYWEHIGGIEGSCSVLADYIEGNSQKDLPYTLAFNMCDNYDESYHEGTDVV